MTKTLQASALVQIRREVKDTLSDKLKPFLPQPAPATPVPAQR